MGCLHAEGCPLFPLLKASLQGWRDYYCDSEDRWRGCARYKLALGGRLVPISLLPNGKDAAYLRRSDERLSTEQTVPTLQPTSFGQGFPVTEASADPRPAAAQPMSSGPSQGFPPSPSPPSCREHAPERRASRRLWWLRLADWMKGSA